MNVLRILHAALTTVLFVASQSASAAVNTAPQDGPAAQASAERSNTEASAHPPAGKVQQGKGQAARANSDRVRSLLNKQASKSRTAVAANRRGAAPTTATSRSAAALDGATRASGDPGPGAAGPSEGRANLSQGRTNLSPGPASAMAIRAAPRAAVALPQNSTARSGTLGGPRVQGSARLGGPVSTKAGRAAPTGTQALNGTQVLRRKY